MSKKIPWYLKTSRIFVISLVGALFGYASIATLLGVDMDSELNKDYYKSKDEPLFIKKKKGD